MEKTREELIKQLNRIRIRLTSIYMKLGNPEKVSADSVLKEDIIMFEDLSAKQEKVKEWEK